ncbi:MAG: sugar transferase [bacterium]
MAEPIRQPDAPRATRAGSLSPRRSGTLRNPRTTTTVLGRGTERGRVVPFPRPPDAPAAPGTLATPRTDARIDRTALALLERERADGLRRVVNVSLAAFFLVPASFVIAVLWVLHHLFEDDRGQFIYKGRRLGKGKRIFTIYKIRTLSRNAERELGANLHVPNGKLESAFGRFLRATRLDELPQLVNIIRGDMDFVGPRPVRPEAYERYRQMIPNYDRTFLVRPGLTGYSQFFTPHSTPKQIRSRIDYRFLTRGSSPFRDVGFIFTTALTVLRNTLRETFNAAADELRIVQSQWSLVRKTLAVSALTNKRVTRRVAREDVEAFLTDESFRVRLPVSCELIDINHEALCLVSPLPLEKNQEVYVVLETYSPRSGRRKRARCRGFVYRVQQGPNGDANARSDGGERNPAPPPAESPDANGDGRSIVVFYEPVTHLNRYIVDQYVLRSSIA